MSMPDDTLAILPSRKRVNHRGPLSVDVSSAWYFITICAEGHAPWVVDETKVDETKIGRAVAPRPPKTRLELVASLILHEARENHVRGIWRVALFLIMSDHLHFIVQIPSGGRGATALPRVIANFKHLLSARYGIRFQRDFFDTRLRDDVHFAEKYEYILGNPVRKGLCATPGEWPYSIAFSRVDGIEIMVGSRVPRDRDTHVSAGERDARPYQNGQSVSPTRTVGARVSRGRVASTNYNLPTTNL